MGPNEHYFHLFYAKKKHLQFNSIVIHLQKGKLYGVWGSFPQLFRTTFRQIKRNPKGCPKNRKTTPSSTNITHISWIICRNSTCNSKFYTHFCATSRIKSLFNYKFTHLKLYFCTKPCKSSATITFLCRYLVMEMVENTCRLAQKDEDKKET